MSRPCVAAIVPVYNRPAAVIEALASVAAQKLPPSVMIVVDDGSSDETPAVIETWLANQRLSFEARLIRQANAGVAAARNRGAEEAGDVDLLAFLDSDDLWPSDYLQRMVRIFADQPDLVAASADRLDVDLRDGTSERTRLTPQRLTATGLLVEGPPGTPTTVIRASAFRQVGGYDVRERCGEDYQLMLRLSVLGRWAVAPGEPVQCRRGTPDSLHGSGQLSRAFDDRRWRLALILDKFVTAEAPPGSLVGKGWRRRLGRLWYAAGRGLLASPEPREKDAAHAFRRAAEYLPWHLRARWRAWQLGR